VSNCNFCGNAIEAGTGKMYIKKDGVVLHFCSSKCQRNQIGLGRINRNVRWTNAAHAAKSPAKAGAKAAVKPAK
jgi:large subunit ribosomal protein L24e